MIENNPTPIMAESAVPAAMVRLPKTLSGIMGSGARVSIHRNSKKPSMLTVRLATVKIEAPLSLAQVIPRIRATMPVMRNERILRDRRPFASETAARPKQETFSFSSRRATVMSSVRSLSG